jgi:hypothetical protein
MAEGAFASSGVGTAVQQEVLAMTRGVSDCSGGFPACGACHDSLSGGFFVEFAAGRFFRAGLSTTSW